MDADLRDIQAIAVVEEDSELTYAQLEALVNQFGNAMLEHGVQVENRILFLMDDCANLIAAYLAAIRIGAVSIAYNLRAVSSDLRYVIDESRAAMLFIDSSLLHVYEEVEAQLDVKPKLIVNRTDDRRGCLFEDFACDFPTQLTSRPMSNDDMALWIYSSGTTGRPKAIVHLHHDVLDSHRHITENLGVLPGDRLFCTSKIFFAYTLGNLFLGGLRSGATLILNRGWPDSEHVASVVARQKPDFFFSVPTFYRNLLVNGDAAQPAFRDLRCCVSAGEALSASLFEQWREATGQDIYEGLGSSETIYLFIANRPGSCRPGYTGRLQPWVEARIVNEDGEDITETTTPGLLWIKTDSVSDRYWNRQQLSRETFVDGWYCTGDMLSIDDDGWWQHHGRQDSMLKISGQWVSPVEIEDRALTAGNIVDAAVVGKEDVDGLVRATLFIVPEKTPEDEASFKSHLLQHLRDGLAIYKCPRNIRLVDELPRTDTGKLKRFVLRQWMEERS